MGIARSRALGGATGRAADDAARTPCGLPHRQTGFESVDEGRHAAYFDCLALEARRDNHADAGYINGDTALFERIAHVEGASNRLIVYRRNSLHSGCIDNARTPPADPVRGRLSINSFIDLQR